MSRTGPATTAATRSTPARSSRNWAGNPPSPSNRASPRPSTGIWAMRNGSPAWFPASISSTMTGCTPTAEREWDCSVGAVPSRGPFYRSSVLSPAGSTARSEPNKRCRRRSDFLWDRPQIQRDQLLHLPVRHADTDEGIRFCHRIAPCSGPSFAADPPGLASGVSGKEFRQPDAQQSVGTVRVAGILPAIRGRDALDTQEHPQPQQSCMPENLHRHPPGVRLHFVGHAYPFDRRNRSRQDYVIARSAATKQSQSRAGEIASLRSQ